MIALTLAVLAISITAYAMWFDRPKMGGRDPFISGMLYGMSWACIIASLVFLVVE